MANLHVDVGMLERFEAELDPRRPERGPVPARVLGFGEISTVLAIGGHDTDGLAFKRMPMFRSAEEAEHYEALHRRYVRTLGERTGLRVAPCNTVRIVQPHSNRVIVYIVQEKQPEDTIGHMAIYRVSPADTSRLIMAILQELSKVFDFNQSHQGDLELGLNGQISNWSVSGFDPDQGRFPDRIRLLFLDTSTPLLRRRGQEQLDPDLFLRSAPSLLLPVVRRVFLPDIMTRYYDFRRVALDMIANLRKEGRPDLIPAAIDTVNWFFLAERREHHFRPITLEEMRRYYRWDALIWRAYLALRKLDRHMCRLRRIDYPYILPKRVSR